MSPIRMVTRVLELVSGAGSFEPLLEVIETKVRPLLLDDPRALQSVTLVSEGEPAMVVLFSMWKSEHDARRYEKELLPEIIQLASEFVRVPEEVRS